MKDYEPRKTTIYDDEKPDDGKMYPYDWIYWELKDKGEDQLAEGVKWLIGDRNWALGIADWQASRRYEVEHKDE